jgi:hypothetical protein
VELEILVGLAGDRRTYNPGDRVQWADKKDAERLIAAGYAKPAGAKQRA